MYILFSKNSARVKKMTNIGYAPSCTEYSVHFGQFFFFNQTENVFFPHQWTRVCPSLDLVTSKETPMFFFLGPWCNYMKRTARSEHEIKLRINKMLEKIERLEQAEAESMIIDEVQSIISLLEVG